MRRMSRGIIPLRFKSRLIRMWFLRKSEGTSEIQWIQGNPGQRMRNRAKPYFIQLNHRCTQMREAWMRYFQTLPFKLVRSDLSVLQPGKSLFSCQRVGRERTQGTQRRNLCLCVLCVLLRPFVRGCDASASRLSEVHPWFPSHREVWLALLSLRAFAACCKSFRPRRRSRIPQFWITRTTTTTISGRLHQSASSNI